MNEPEPRWINLTNIIVGGKLQKVYASYRRYRSYERVSVASCHFDEVTYAKECYLVLKGATVHTENFEICIGSNNPKSRTEGRG